MDLTARLEIEIPAMRRQILTALDDYSAEIKGRVDAEIEKQIQSTGFTDQIAEACRVVISQELRDLVNREVSTHPTVRRAIRDEAKAALDRAQAALDKSLKRGGD